MQAVKRNKFVKSKLGGENLARYLMDSDTIFEIEKNVAQLKAPFLKSYYDLEVVLEAVKCAILEEFVEH